MHTKNQTKKAMHALGSAIKTSPRLVACSSNAVALKALAGYRQPIVIDGKRISKKDFVSKYRYSIRCLYRDKDYKPSYSDYCYSPTLAINTKIQFPLHVRLTSRLQHKYGERMGHIHVGYGNTRAIYTVFTNEADTPALDFNYYRRQVTINYKKIMPNKLAHQSYYAIFQRRDFKTGAPIDDYIICEGSRYEIISDCVAKIPKDTGAVYVYRNKHSQRVFMLWNERSYSFYHRNHVALNTDSISGITYNEQTKELKQRGKVLCWLDSSYGYISGKCKIQVVNNGANVKQLTLEQPVGNDIERYQTQDGNWHYKSSTLDNIVKPAALALAGVKPITPAVILSTRNADVRTELIRSYGLDRLIEHAKLVDSAKQRHELGQDIPQVWLDSDYRLYDMKQILDTRAPAYYLYMANQTVKGMYHLEGVHPCCMGLLPVALAWRARLIHEQMLLDTKLAYRGWGNNWFINSDREENKRKLEALAMQLQSEAIK